MYNHNLELHSQNIMRNKNFVLFVLKSFSRTREEQVDHSKGLQLYMAWHPIRQNSPSIAPYCFLSSIFSSWCVVARKQ